MYRTLLVSLLVVAALLAGGVGSVGAQSNPQLTCGGETGEIQIDQVVALYNENTDAVPSMIGSIAASNTTELQINNAAQEYYTLQADGSLQITAVKRGAADDPNVIVETDRETACSLYTAEDPVAAFNQARAAGDITIKGGDSPVDKAKVFIVKRATDIAGMFGTAT
jgi:hypothetical protein